MSFRITLMLTTLSLLLSVAAPGFASVPKTEKPNFRAPTKQEQIITQEHVLSCQGALAQITHLDDDTFRSLVKTYQATGDTNIRRRLAASYYGFAVAQAKILCRGRGLSVLQPCINVAMLGVMRAVDKFNADRDIKFVTYAGYWIRAEVSDYLNSNRSFIRPPSANWVYNHFNKIERARASILSRNPHTEITVELLAEHLKMKVADIQDLLEIQNAINVGSLDQARSADSKGGYNTTPASNEPADKQYESSVFKSRRLKVLHAFSEDLKNDRERKIFWIRFMWDGDQKDIPTPGELAKDFQVSRERIRQIEVSIRTRLRTFLRNYDPEYLGFTQSIEPEPELAPRVRIRPSRAQRPVQDE